MAVRTSAGRWMGEAGLGILSLLIVSTIGLSLYSPMLGKVEGDVMLVDPVRTVDEGSEVVLISAAVGDSKLGGESEGKDVS